MTLGPTAKTTVKIGPILRARRKELNLTLNELADSVGVTKGFLSDVERDKASPSVASLVQICKALRLPIGDLFPESDAAIIRKSERVAIKFGGQKIDDYQINPYPNSRFQAILSFMEPGGGTGTQLYSIESQEEFIFVLQGSVRVVVEGEEVLLREGDTMTFNPRQLHSTMNASDTEPANVLFIISPAPRQ